MEAADSAVVVGGIGSSSLATGVGGAHEGLPSFDGSFELKNPDCGLEALEVGCNLFVFA